MALNELIEKFSSYNIFNYLLPGTVFAYMMDRTTDLEFVLEDYLIAVFFYYFLGLVISRFGSIVVEGSLKKVGLIKFGDYGDYVKATDKDLLLPVLSEQNNVLRTLIALVLFILGGQAYSAFTPAECEPAVNALLLVALLVLLVFSYRKQTDYISARARFRQTDG